MRALDAANARNQHLVVVHASEQVLRLLQRPDPRHRARSAEFARDFQRIAQLLDGDAHLVQAIRQVEPGGVLNRLAETDGAPRGTDLRVGQPLRVAAASLGAFGGRGCGTVPQLVDVDAADTRAHFGVHPLPFLADHLAQLGDGAARRVGVDGHRVQHFERDVELANRTERAGKTTDLTLELASPRPRGDERQRFAQPARRDARLVQRQRIPLLRPGRARVRAFSRWRMRSSEGSSALSTSSNDR